jgi:hypothetical protein
MDPQEVDFSPTPAATDPQTKELAEISKTENQVEKDPSYVRSRQIALKKFAPPEVKPS